MNHFKFSDTLGGYSLRYQEPIPRGRAKEVGKIRGDKSCVFQFKMNYVIYILPGISHKINRQISQSAKNNIFVCVFLGQNGRP